MMSGAGICSLFDSDAGKILLESLGQKLRVMAFQPVQQMCTEGLCLHQDLFSLDLARGWGRCSNLSIFLMHSSFPIAVATADTLTSGLRAISVREISPSLPKLDVIWQLPQI